MCPEIYGAVGHSAPSCVPNQNRSQLRVVTRTLAQVLVSQRIR